MDDHNDKDDVQDDVQDAIAEFAKDEAERDRRKQEKKPKKDRRPIYYAIIAVCIVIIAIQIPKIVSLSKQEPKPNRLGATQTDELTDACINNLWAILQTLQLKETDISEYSCPLNKKPYILTKNKDGYTVECPNATLHGFSHVRITTSKPIPELIP